MTAEGEDALLYLTDSETRRHGERTGFDTPIVRAVNYDR